MIARFQMTAVLAVACLTSITPRALVAQQAPSAVQNLPGDEATEAPPLDQETTQTEGAAGEESGEGQGREPEEKAQPEVSAEEAAGEEGSPSESGEVQPETASVETGEGAENAVTPEAATPSAEFEIVSPEKTPPTEPESPPSGAAQAATVPTSSAVASDVESGAGAPQTDDPDALRLFLGADFSTFLGQGTFVAHSEARNPYVGWLLSLRPTLMPTKATRIYLVQFFSQELTDTDSDTKNHRVLLSDTWLGSKVNFYTWPKTKTAFEAGLVAHFPTSKSSRYETLLLALRPGLGFTQPITEALQFSFRTEFLKNFHSYTSPVGKVDEDGDTVFLGRSGGNELIGASRVSPGGNNISYEFWNRALLSYRFWDGWALSGFFLLVNGFAYENHALDDLSGTGAQGGRGRRNRGLAELSLGHTWRDTYNLSGGVVTQGAVATADGSRVRFPFYDFTSVSHNLTSFFLRFTIDYSVLGASEKRTTPYGANEPRPTEAF